MARQELARFLRDRRHALDPEALGMPTATARRTAGLRREEVAARAAMSVDYYVRLEQARGPHPSPRVLDALSRALILDDAGRRHLFRLADTVLPPPAGPSHHVRPHIAALLHRMPDTAVIVTNAAYDVVAFNSLAERLLGQLRDEPNLARRRFLHGRHWSSASDEFAEVAVARLRAAADRYPRDSHVAAVIAELRAGSDDVVRVWEDNPVRAAGHRTKTTDHPEVGLLHLTCDVLTVPDDDQQVVFVTAEPDTPTARALRQLNRTTCTTTD